MGYALFANRKLMYSNMVYSLQCQLDQVMKEKQNLLNFAASIGDGVITSQEAADDISNYTNYCIFEQEFGEYIKTPDELGGGATTLAMFGASIQNAPEADRPKYESAAMSETRSKFAQQYSKRLEAMENRLDQRQKKLESQISVAQSQLEAVEQAEGQAIEKATPKYNGVG